MFIVIVAAIIWVVDIYNRPNMIAKILKIEKPPKSMKVHGCSYPFTSDILTTCAISIDSKEFEMLIAGYEYKKIKVNGSSFKFVGPKVGQEFEADVMYSVEPKEYAHGGFVRVIVNRERNYALIDDYIE